MLFSYVIRVKMHCGSCGCLQPPESTYQKWFRLPEVGVRMPTGKGGQPFPKLITNHFQDCTGDQEPVNIFIR